jgi:hypothetical protein
LPGELLLLQLPLLRVKLDSWHKFSVHFAAAMVQMPKHLARADVGCMIA